LAWAKIDESEQSVVHLYQMWVAANFRRRGAGQMLLYAAIAWAKASRAEAIVLGVKLWRYRRKSPVRASRLHPGGPA
jgi:ribosomal protein S18 acetylase RimI-like enzyme